MATKAQMFEGTPVWDIMAEVLFTVPGTYEGDFEVNYDLSNGKVLSICPDPHATRGLWIVQIFEKGNRRRVTEKSVAMKWIHASDMFRAYVTTDQEAAKVTSPAVKTTFEVILPDGTVWSRTSTRNYTHAIIRRNKGTKTYFVNLATSHAKAQKEAAVQADTRNYIEVISFD